MLASIWKKPLDEQIYKVIDHELINSKLDIIQDEMRANIATDLRRIKREHRNGSGAATMLRERLDAHVRRTDEWAQRVYQVFREVWLQQGGVECPEFFLVVYRKALVVLIENRSREVIDHLLSNATRNALSKETLQALELPFRRNMQQLLKNWKKRVNIRMSELAYQDRPRQDVSKPCGLIRESSKRRGRPTIDPRRHERLGELKAAGRSWAQITLTLNREFGLDLTKDAYRQQWQEQQHSKKLKPTSPPVK